MIFFEFRPISLCNVCYKIVSKILANRLSYFLPTLISAEQGAFVKGRLIHENIALTQELIQHIDKGKEGGNVILNIDMEKAFDRLNWAFLFEVLTRFGFSVKTYSGQFKKGNKHDYYCNTSLSLIFDIYPPF